MPGVSLRTESRGDSAAGNHVVGSSKSENKTGGLNLKELRFVLFLHVFPFLLSLRFSSKNKPNCGSYFSFLVQVFLDIGFVPEYQLYLAKPI